MARVWTRELAQQIKEGKARKGKWLNSFITLGQVLEELALEGLFISRDTIYRLERSGLFKLRRTVGGQRTLTRAEADAVKTIIWVNYTGLSHEKYKEQEELEKQIERRTEDGK